MTPEDAKNELEQRIKQFGIRIADLTPQEGIRLMLAFYKEIRADSCEISNDGDMLLFQWGTYDWGNGPSFECGITRQFTAAHLEDEDDDAAISQLSLAFHFPPSAELEAIKSSDRWCYTPDGLADFEAFIVESEAYQAIHASRPSTITLNYGET